MKQRHLGRSLLRQTQRKKQNSVKSKKLMGYKIKRKVSVKQGVDAHRTARKTTTRMKNVQRQVALDPPANWIGCSVMEDANSGFTWLASVYLHKKLTKMKITFVYAVRVTIQLLEAYSLHLRASQTVFHPLIQLSLSL